MPRRVLPTSLAICLGIFIAVAGPAVVAAGEFSRVVVFGDSLSDPANAFLLLQRVERPPFDPIPDAPYASLHFTNGVTWVERLAARLGVPLTAGPALLFPKVFSNYAVGGARAREEGDFHLAQQVDRYLVDVDDTGSPRALHVVFIGANDLRDALEALATDPSGATSFGIVSDALGAIQANILRLVESGARTFLVPNAPNLALVPAVPVAARPAAQLLSEAFRDGLEATLSGLEGLPLPFTLTFTRLNVFELLNSVVENPRAFGLREAATPCLRFGVVKGAICSHPDRFLFWDGIHPTRAGHELLSDEAEAVLSAP